MKRKMDKKGIIFDMDGTLWDAREEIAFSWSETIAKSKLTERILTVEDMTKVMGKPMDELMRSLFPELTEGERQTLYPLLCQRENDYLREHGAKIYPGVEEVFATLHKEYFLAIVSNCQEGYIEAFLEYYGFENYIDDIQCFGMNEKQKDENIRLVADRNELTEAIYVGDIYADYVASQKAGVGFIHAAYGFGDMKENVPCIQNCYELPKVLKMKND